VLQAAGGLLVAVVVKYADNILKGFAASFAIVITFLFSMFFANFYPNQNFYIGAVSGVLYHYRIMHSFQCIIASMLFLLFLYIVILIAISMDYYIYFLRNIYRF
jgi:hypothetical protein